jgi:hypothetical protein
LNGTVSTVAGLASPFGNPMGIVRVGTGIYVADAQFSVIWKVDANSGATTVFAGVLGQPGYNDATGTSAMFDAPEGLAADSTYLYVADQFIDVTTCSNPSHTPDITLYSIPFLASCQQFPTQ